MENVSRMIVTYLINSAWQLPVVLVLAFLGSLILRRAPARWSHLLWVSAVVIGSLLPLWSMRAVLPEPQLTLTALDSQNVIGIDGSAAVATSVAPTTHRSWFHVASLPPLVFRPHVIWAITGCYFLFLLYRALRLAMAARHTWYLRSLAVDSSAYGDLQCVVEQYSARLRLKEAPPVFLSDGIGPLTVGIRRPILLMPSGFCDTAGEPEIRAAVCHELAHIKRHDFLLNLACEFILLPVCYHPLSALIKARIDRSREMACDDMAAELMAAPAVYARSLVSIAKSISTSSVPRLSCGQGLFDTDKMEERIMNLLWNRPIIGNRWARALAVASVASLGVISVAAATLSVQVIPQTAPVISSTMTSSQVSSEQNVGATVMPAPAQKYRPTTMPPVAESSEIRHISIRHFTLLSGEIPGANEALSEDLKSRTYGNSIAGEIAQRVRNFYQERGYFKAHPSEPEIHQDGSNVDVSISVDAGQQYRLADIQFTGNKVFTTAALRALFPIQTGDVFKASAIAAGLDATRSLYASSGLTQAISMVETKIDDTTRTILVNVVTNEGRLAASSVLLPGYYKVGNGVSAPIAIETPEPQYDPVARAAKAEGVGVYQVALAADGTVQMVQPVSGVYPDLHPSLIQSGMDAIRKWKFQPGLKDGHPVPVQLNVEVHFRLY